MKLKTWQKFLLVLLITYTAWLLYIDALYDPTPDTLLILATSFIIGFFIVKAYDLNKKSKN